MFILLPNCIVPSATLLTMSPVLPSLLYLIPHNPFAANDGFNSEVDPVHQVVSGQSVRSIPQC